MFIQTEDTPNPNSLKFIPGAEVSPESPVSFSSADDCDSSPLARELFKIKYVAGVFFGDSFITITKQKNKDWSVIKPEILLTIMEHFSSNMPIFIKKKPVVDKAKSIEGETGEDSDIVSQIKELIEYRVRPAVAEDGGDIVFHSFENGIVKVELYGSCSGCPSSTVTLKSGIESMLRHYIPEVEAVEAINIEKG